MNVQTKSLSLMVVAALLTVAGCSQPDSEPSASASDTALLDLNAPPSKVTADDYRFEPVPSGDGPLASVNAAGEIAPFGMASREQRDVAAATVAAVAEAVSSAASAVYTTHCVACHGADAKGVEGLGLTLVGSTLVTNSSQAELIDFLKAGRMPGSPDSVTGIPMPSFAWMSDGDLEEVAGFLKAL